MSMVDGPRAWLAPSLCQFCSSPAAHGIPICAACAAALPWNHRCCPRCALPQAHDAPCADCAERPPVFDSAWCAFRLETPVQGAIHGLKYHAGFLHAHALGTLMARELARRRAPLPQLLIPVPLHRQRLFWRGYNQAAELARAMTRTLGVAVDSGAARRVRRTDDQIGRSAAERRRNVKGAFALERPLDGLHVALLDDVMTTGATLAELARSCRHAGARRIEVWAAARVA